MSIRRASWQAFSCLIVVIATYCHAARLSAAAPLKSDSASCTLYHADPEHLWNRLRQALFVRIGPDGRGHGHDRLEPLLWPGSRYLLTGDGHRRAVAVLEEFNQHDGEKLIADPLKRAVLQRDLWLVFDWLAGEHVDLAPVLAPQAADEALDRLRRSLVANIRRLALSHEDIGNLPDNYAQSLASGEFASRFDPRQPERPYLPPDLFAVDGSWVCVGRADGITAPRHLNETGTNRFTNSAFLVFVRLPDGRGATLDYLQRLTSFDQPLLVANPTTAAGSRPFVPNAALPQFPKGTQLALVRRMLLVDASRRVVASPIIESLQLRIIHAEVPSATPDIVADATRSSPAGRERAEAWQTFHELRLSRAALFEKRAGGLRFVSADEQDFKTGFNAHPYDLFDQTLRGDESFASPNRRPRIRHLCVDCHTLPGVYSFNSLQDFRSRLSRDGDKLRAFPLSVMTVEEVLAAAVRWKETRPSWHRLKKLLAE